MQLSNKTYNYLYLIFLLIYIYRPLAFLFEVGRSCLLRDAILVLTISYIFYFSGQFRSICRQTPVVIWTLLVVYHLFNSIFITKNLSLNNFDTYSICSDVIFNLLIMLLSAFLFINDAQRTIRVVLLATALYAVLGIIEAKIHPIDYGYATTRITGTIHATQIAQMGGIVMILVAYSRWISNKKWSDIIFTVIGFMVILMSEGRNGLIIFVSGLICYFFANYFIQSFSVNKFLRIALFVIIGVIAFYLILNFTNIGNRISNLDDSLKYAKNYQTGNVFDKLGERTRYYYLGAIDFKENPINGIGYFNFAKYNNIKEPVHPEYMLHLAEGGSIASILFLAFIVVYGYKIFTLFKSSKDEIIVIHIATLITILIICLSAVIFYKQQFWSLIGFAIADFYTFEHSENNDETENDIE